MTTSAVLGFVVADEVVQVTDFLWPSRMIFMLTGNLPFCFK